MTETTQLPAPQGATPASRSVPGWLLLLVGVAALVIATAALTASLVGGRWSGWGPAAMTASGNGSAGYGPGMMGGLGQGGSGYGPGGSGYGPGMMGGLGQAGPAVNNGVQPGDPGFVAGTPAAPRVVRIVAGPGYTFTPSIVTVQRGETITFEVTGMGPLVHELMVGPADAVAADADGTPEIENITMMSTASLTYTFDGDGPYAYACHADGHYEAGMTGTIKVVD
jgi:uncharacterized cupredoxin-like copper-binding protein